MRIPQWFRRLGAPGEKRIAVFLGIFGRWMEQGMAPAQAATALLELYRGRREALMAQTLLEAMQAGKPMSAGFGLWLSASDRHRLAAIEQQDALAGRVQSLADEMQRRSGMAVAILGKLGYGGVLVALTVFILITVVQGEILPVLRHSGLLQHRTFEFLMLEAVSEHLAAFWYLWLVIPACFAAILPRIMSCWVGSLRSLADASPPLRWYRHRRSSELLQALSAMVESGDTWMIAAQRLAPSATPYCRWLLHALQGRLTEGRSPVSALQLSGWLCTSSWLQLKAVAGNPDLAARAAVTGAEQMQQSDRELMTAVRVGQFLLYLLAGCGLFLILSTGRVLGSVDMAAF